MKILMSLVALFLCAGAHASQIQMYDNGAPLVIAPVERVVVQGPEIYVRTAIHACANYPGYPDKIYGDVYECFTSRERLSQFLNDNNIRTLPDPDLSQYLIAIKQTFSCANRSGKPELVPYLGKNVYWFSGLLLSTTASSD